MMTRIAAGQSANVLFDAYWAVDGPPSGRNVLQSLVKSWVAHFPEDRVTVCVPRYSGTSIQLARDFFGPGVSIVTAAAPIRNHGIWVNFSFIRLAHRYDVMISQNFVPLLAWRRGVTRAVFLHDGIFIDHPEWFTRLERLYLGAIAPGLRRASVILTSSKAESSRISRIWPRVATKTLAIGMGVPESLARADPVEPAGRGTGSRPFILTVGRLNVRKNLAALIAAYQASTSVRAHFDLVIVGAADGMAESMPASTGVKFAGHVSDGELRWLYENSRLFVFPSLDEGFGLPLLEAELFGTPAIASDIPPFREIGTAVAYFDPHSVGDITRCLESNLDATKSMLNGEQLPLGEWLQVVARARNVILQQSKGAGNRE